jgi:carboxymethylenebutenolidase
MKAITTEEIRVEVSDGTTLGGYLALPQGAGPHPGLLVFQEIFGVNPHIRDITERLARQGYAALAPDLFHRITPGYQGSYDDIDASIAVAMKVMPADLEADLHAAAKYMGTHPAVRDLGAIGFCLGGFVAFLANAVLPLKAAVSYYGGRIAPALLPLTPRLSGPTLFFWAEKDGFIPLEQHRSVADSLRQHGKPFVDVEFGGVDHGFFCDARSHHDPKAAAQSWALSLAFLKDHLGG